MSEKMITVKGKDFSEDTIVEALKKQCLFEEEKEEEPYVFKVGDVARNRADKARIILRINGEMRSINNKGIEESEGQHDFEVFGYKLIGVLSDFIK